MEPTIRELLADLAGDADLSGTVANLEGQFLQPLEGLTQDPALLDAVCEVRRTLAHAGLALRRLALVEASHG